MSYTIKQAPKIRSLVRVTLPKFFDAHTYIWNRYSSADALLIDIRQYTEENEHWRREVLYNALDGAPYKPRIYLEATSRRISRAYWSEDVAACSRNTVFGLMLKVKDGDVLKEVENIVQRDGIQSQELVHGDHRVISNIVPHYHKEAALLVDFELKAIPYAIFKYHNFGSRAEASWSRLKDLVTYAKLADVKSLAWRTVRTARSADVEREMNMLKEIGFSGVLIRNPAWIDMANKIFE